MSGGDGQLQAHEHTMDRQSKKTDWVLTDLIYSITELKQMVHLSCFASTQWLLVTLLKF